MKTKHIFLLMLLTFSNVLLTAQKIKDGVYSNENKIICVQDDTLVIFNKGDVCHVFKGKYRLTDNQIVLDNNIFLGKNANIVKENCSSDKIEIILKSIYITNAVFGERCDNPVFAQNESPYYHIVLNDICVYSEHGNNIVIDRSQFSDTTLSNGFILADDARLSGFVDYFDFPLEYGTRYIIIQKYFSFRPYLINQNIKSSKKLAYQHGNIIECFNDQHTEKYEYNNDCDSCYNILKHKFPLLLE